MALKQKLESDLLIAMRKLDTDLKNVLRMALSSIKLFEIENRGGIDDLNVITILQKEIKLRGETIVEAKKIDRIDLIEQCEKEIRILESYLPKQISEIELKKIVECSIKELNAQNMKDMGKVMKDVITKVAGSASNEIISKLIRDSLGK